MEVRLYRCSHCGNIVIKLVDKNVPLMCCGQKMEELVPGTVDASVEKHVPVIRQDNGYISVLVGAVEHPMTPEHFISHVIIETTAGIQIAELHPGDEPRAVFAVLDGVEIIAAYAYCNLHGFWKSCSDIIER